ncbi:RNA polymerase sigma factor [Fimbriiglobus ruber]|uniref:High-affnity carbon uptake protein Hat/HatR n=1 Tax=Fimbriiglobus ruber TaxID=1908690 RepID=A0A225DWH2_9BACT|nr:RNA polymerase sigma factor [Fimbriiglobus ruber]OWK45732.1 High-affnity carbon uptake protein Hat/HatR [Fimbriiglobus ruber]
MIRVLRLLRAGAGSDQDLLARYVRDRDEAAFEALVHRYGRGVWTACVRLAGRDADDAFQAVFLTLSRKAGTVTGSLPAWLHAVTRRVASTLRRTARRRAAIEAAAARSDRAEVVDPSFREGLALLDEELARLPDRYRAVLIVCCLEGRSRDDAAAQLGWTEGQVKGRLERAREMLRARLARRGVELGGLLLAAAVIGPVPTLADTPSATAITLTHGVIRAMTVEKLKLVAVMACVGVAIASGVVLRAQPDDPAPALARPDGAAKAPPAAPKERPADPQDKDKGKPPPEDRKAEAARKIKDLQAERITTLRDLTETSLALYKNARASYEGALEARILLLKAELEVATDDAARMDLYKKCVDALTGYEEIAKAQHQGARGTIAAVLGIKARRLEVEIQIEQAKAKEDQKAGK